VHLIQQIQSVMIFLSQKTVFVYVKIWQISRLFYQRYILLQGKCFRCSILGYLPYNNHIASIITSSNDLFQTRYINDTAGRNSFILPPLEASHVQNKALNFSLTDSSGTFGIYSNGTLFITSSASLFDYNILSVFSLIFAVTDTSSLRTTSTVTISLVDTNKAPYFSSSTISRSVNEGATVGELIGLPISASDLNLVQTVSHSITSCQPQMWIPSRASFICPISIDSASGQLSVSSFVPGGVLLADRNATFSGNTFVYSLTVRAVDNGVPSLSATTSVSVTIANIAPRLSGSTVSIAGDASAATQVFTLSSLLWSAYPSNTVSYTLLSTVQTAEGSTALSIVNTLLHQAFHMAIQVTLLRSIAQLV
jgi:hypothetical protein